MLIYVILSSLRYTILMSTIQEGKTLPTSCRMILTLRSIPISEIFKCEKNIDRKMV